MDTGRAGMIGSIAKDFAFGKKFFKAQGLLPSTPIREDVYTYPAPDFQNMGGGYPNITRLRGQADFEIGAPGNFGWDMGALKTKVLMVVSQRVRQSDAGIFISDSLPSAANLPNGSYLFNPGQVSSNAAAIYKRSGGSFTSLGSNADFKQDFQASQSVWTVALSYNATTHKLILFLRTGPEQWLDLVEITDATFSTMRYAGIYAVNGGIDVFHSICPLGIWAEA